MKKIVSVLLVFVMVLSFCACGNSGGSTYDSADGKVAITKEMVKEIRETVFTVGNELSFVWEMKALSPANARIGVMSGYEDIKEFTSVKITSEDYEDDWHYCFYGKIYGKDNYNKEVSYDYSMTIVCEKDSSTADGYKIDLDSISVKIK